jgi:hypothetical protein
VPTPEQLEQQAQNDALRAQTQAQRDAAVAAHAERRAGLRARRDARVAAAAARNPAIVRAAAEHNARLPQDAREAQVDAIMNQRMAEVARELGVPHLAPAPQAPPAVEPAQFGVDSREIFNRNIRDGTIPADATYGGIHMRNCGARGCRRCGGAQGVRFLLWNGTGNRRYRCELHQNAE